MNSEITDKQIVIYRVKYNTGGIIMNSRFSFKFISIKQKSVFFKFMLSFSILILIPILTLGIVFNYVFSENFYNETRKYNNILLVRTSEKIEQNMYELKQMMYRKTFLVNIELSNYSRISEVVNELKRINASNQFIDDIFVFYNGYNKVITDHGMYDSSLFFNNVYKIEGMSDEDRNIKLNNSNNFHVLPIEEIITSSGGKVNAVMVLTSFPLYSTQTKGTLIAIVKEDTLNHMLDSNGEQLQSKLAIIDKDNGIITETMNITDERLQGNEKSYKSVISALGKDNNNNIIIDYNETETSVSYFMSSFANWIYMVLTPIDKIMAKVVFFRNFVAGLSIFLFAIGIFLSVIVTKNLYKPINEIVSMFKSNIQEKRESKDNENEFKYIINHLKYVFNRNYTLEENANKSVAVIKKYYLKSLLLGGDTDNSQDNDISGVNRIFKYPFYVVVIVALAEPLRERHKIDKNELQQKKDEVLMKMHQKFMGEGFLGTITNIKGGRISVVVNFTEEFSLKSYIDNITLELLKVWNHPFLPLDIGVGGIYNNIESINQSYEEAIQSLEYRTIYDTNKVLYYSEVSRNLKDIKFSCPIETEKAIIYSVMSGDVDSVKRLIEDIFEGLISEQTAYGMIVSMYNELLYILMKALSKNRNSINELMVSELTDMLNTNSLWTLKEIQDNVIKIYSYITTKFCEEKRSNNELMKERIISYLDSNYYKDISLETVADQVGLNPKYVSRFFKEQNGMNFINYLNSLRIDKAKEILTQNKDLKIKCIGEKVGFTSTNTFINTFKKYEGITPGKFRDNSEIVSK